MPTMSRFRRSGAMALILGLLCFTALATTGGTAHAASNTAPFSLQVMDSCRQAIPGARFVLTGNGLNIPAGPTPGTKPVTVVHGGSCPAQRGNCVIVPTGCASWNVPIPTTSTLTYQITETAAPAGYMPCTGGSVCTGGPVTVTLTITSAGLFAATARNVYPDGSVKVWPTSGAPYTGQPTDPAVVHNFQLGTGSCDGDNDADDHLTGSPSSHCDNDKDK